jgi:hypothetical protein
MRSGYWVAFVVPDESWSGVIVIQWVRVRWTAAARGAPYANARRGLDRAAALPASLPAGEVVVHEVLADEAVDYVRREDMLAGELRRSRDVGLWLSVAGMIVTVERLPGWAAYPRSGRSARLFSLGPGQVGRYRANFRFTGCACNPSWFYETWTVHISNGSVDADRFVRGTVDYDVDNRMHLYGGASSAAGRERRP